MTVSALAPTRHPLPLRLAGAPVLLFVLLGWSPRGAQESDGNRDNDGTAVPSFSTPGGTVSIPNSGEARIQIPLAAPPGLRGLSPGLGLAYASAAPESGLGAGWSLGIGFAETIERSTRRGVPSYDDARDTFTYAGQKLVRDGASYRYRTEIDNFLRIVRNQDDSWTVTQKNGTRLDYGASVGERSWVPGRGTYAWHLARITDTAGNHIELRYAGDPELQQRRRLQALDYGEQGVVLVWQDNPPGHQGGPRTRANGSVGGLVFSDQRLDRIETTSGGAPVRTFELLYADEVTAPTDRGHSLLARIVESGADGAGLAHDFVYQEKQPGWQSDSSYQSPEPFVYRQYSASLIQDRVVDAGVRMSDLNGDGWQDLVAAGLFAAHKVYLHHGSNLTWRVPPSGWALPRLKSGTEVAFLEWSASGGYLLDRGLRLVDVNGDGRGDFVHAANGDQDVWLNTGSGWGASNAGYRLPAAVNFVHNHGDFTNDLGVRLDEVNGDGLPDLLIASDSNHAVYLNTGAGWEENGDWDLADPDLADPIRGWPVNFARTSDGNPSTSEAVGVNLVDINPDGLVDIVRAFDHTTENDRPCSELDTALCQVFLNTGHGFAESDWSFPLPFRRLGQDYAVQLVDANGDGYPDVLGGLRIGTGNTYDRNWVYLNNQVDGFVKAWQVPVAFAHGPGSAWQFQETGVRTVDVNGDGLSDLVQAYDAASSSGLPIGPFVANSWLSNRGTSITGFRRAIPDLVEQYTTPLRGTNDFKDRRASGLGAGPGAVMPFTRTVVSEVIEDGGLQDPQVRAEYDFQDGSYDWRERDFRGFTRSIERRNGVIGERAFHTDQTRKGRLVSEVRRDPFDGRERKFSERQLVYEVRVVANTFQTLLAEEVSIRYDQDDESTLATSSKSYRYDGYGNTTEVQESGWHGTGGCVPKCDERSADPGSDETIHRSSVPIERRTTTAYAVNTDAFIVDAPASIERFRGLTGERLSAKYFCYDGGAPPPGGGACSSEPSQGLLTRVEEHDDRLKSVTLAAGSAVVVNEFRHDPVGNVSWQRNGRGYETSYDWAANGYLFPHTETSGSLVRKTLYDRGLGVVLEETDANAQTTTHRYDGLGRLVRSYYPGDVAGDPLGASLEIVYQIGSAPPAKMIASEMLSPGSRARQRIRYQYLDGLGRAKSTVVGAFSTWVVNELVRYDASSQRAEVWQPFYGPQTFTEVGPNGRSTRYTFEDEKVKTIALPGGRDHASFRYEADAVVATDENGVRTRRRHDPFGQLTEVTTDLDGAAPTKGTTTLTYDALGGLASVRDPRGLVTSYLFDAAGRARGLNSPDGAESLRNGYQVWNDHDQQGNHTDRWAGSDVWRAGFDEHDRRTTLEVSRQGGAAGSWQDESRWGYDSGKYGRGRLTQVTGNDPSTTNRLVYDRRGRLVVEAFYFNQLGIPSTINGIGYTYDRGNHLERIHDPRGREIVHGFDDLGRVNSLSYGGRIVIPNIEYDAAGRPTRIDYPHGYADQMVHDARGRTTTEFLGDEQCLDCVQFFDSDRYDGVGNLLHQRSWSDPGQPQPNELTYEYDDLGRLTSATGATRAGALEVDYDYDDAGNILSVTGAGTVNVDYGYVAGRNRLDRVHYAGHPFSVHHDQHGNVESFFDDIAGQTDRSYHYDALGRLRSYEVAGRTGSMNYDGRGRKVRRSRGVIDSEIYFHTIGSHVLSTYRIAGGQGQWQTYLAAAGRRLAVVDGRDEVRFLHPDRLGSTRAITRTDPNTGLPEVVWQAEYLPYGTEVGATGTGDNYRFTGQELDPGVGIYDYGARYYDPTLRRFLQADGKLGDPSDPRTLNRYSYSLNHPLRFVDPSGQEACPKEASSDGGGGEGEGEGDKKTQQGDSGDPDCKGKKETEETEEEAAQRKAEEEQRREAERRFIAEVLKRLSTEAVIDGTNQAVLSGIRPVIKVTFVWNGINKPPIMLLEQNFKRSGLVLDAKVNFLALEYSVQKGAQFDTKVPFNVTRNLSGAYGDGGVSLSYQGLTLELGREGVYVGVGFNELAGASVGVTEGSYTVTRYAPPGSGRVPLAEYTVYSNGSYSERKIE